MPSKKPRGKQGGVRFHPGQEVKAIRGTHAEGRFLERWPKTYIEMHKAYLRTIARLSRKRAMQGLTPEERKELAEAYKNMRRLTRKLEQVYVSRAKQASAKTRRDPKFKVFLTDKYFKEMFRIRGKEHKQSSLAFLDIDHLKEINDGYGHRAGDIVIKSVGEALEETIGERGGLVGRHGGEEILVWAPMKEEELIKALKKASRNAKEKIAKRMEEAGIRFLREVSFSAGIVPVSANEIKRNFQKAYKTLVNSADKLMYESKRKGKNAVTIRSKGKLETVRLS
jgi:diguanylate cyclase (GGDEF)-like protein